MMLRTINNRFSGFITDSKPTPLPDAAVGMRLAVGYADAPLPCKPVPLLVPLQAGQKAGGGGTGGWVIETVTRLVWLAVGFPRQGLIFR